MNHDLQQRDDVLNLKLQQLVEEIKRCSASSDSATIRGKRRIALNKLVNAIHSSGRLSRQSKWLGEPNYEDYYNEALQLTLMEVCQKIDEYNPQYPVMAWVNKIFGWRFIDVKNKELTRGLTQIPKDQKSATVLCLDDINNENFLPNDISELEQLKEIIQQDSEGFLKSEYFSKYPQVNLQTILLMLLAEKRWKEISQELGVPISTISSFYQRRMSKIIAYIQKYI
ncbi:MAG: sigma-70 family RNA polymerase sigma factor [Richelia sp. RM2_1_2]|nr:sigma-70 family RNA polymerase sigma factor [Richelia sp. RM2_1_2]